MEELSPDKYQAIKEFSKGLTDCFINYKNSHPDTISNIVLDYAIAVIAIHLQLADLKVDQYLINQEKAQK